MNPDILQQAVIILLGLGIGFGIAALIRTILTKRRKKAEASRASRALAEAEAEQKSRAARRKLEADRAAATTKRTQEKERALRDAYEAELRPVKALLENTAKNNTPRIHNQRKRPAPAPKNTQSRTVNGRNEIGYYDDNGLWMMLTYNEIIQHSYFDNLRAEHEAARTDGPATTDTTPAPEPTYAQPEYSTPDYSSSSDSSSSSSYDSGSSSSYDSGSSFGGGDSGSF